MDGKIKELDKIRELKDYNKKKRELQAPSEMEYYLDTIEKIVEKYYALQPFQVGDKIKLTKKIDFEKANGWRGHRDMLRIGAIGTVTELSYNGYYDYMGYVIEFDYGFWYSDVCAKERIEKNNKGGFCMHDKMIKKATKTDIRKNDIWNKKDIKKRAKKKK